MNTFVLCVNWHVYFIFSTRKRWFFLVLHTSVSVLRLNHLCYSFPLHHLNVFLYLHALLWKKMTAIDRDKQFHIIYFWACSWSRFCHAKIKYSKKKLILQKDNMYRVLYRNTYHTSLAEVNALLQNQKKDAGIYYLVLLQKSIHIIQQMRWPSPSYRGKWQEFTCGTYDQQQSY